MKAMSIRGVCAKYGVKINSLDIESGLIDFDVEYFEAHHVQFLEEIEKILTAEE